MIQFFWRGEERTFEYHTFTRKMLEAHWLYRQATGEFPTHCVLGLVEYAEFEALGEWFQAQGMSRRAAQSPPEFHGMKILKGAEESLILPCRMEGKK